MKRAKRAQLVERWQQRLAENIASSKRQMQFAGERLGVFHALNELAKERRRIAKRLIELDPERELDYAQHLF